VLAPRRSCPLIEMIRPRRAFSCCPPRLTVPPPGPSGRHQICTYMLRIFHMFTVTRLGLALRPRCISLLRSCNRVPICYLCMLRREHADEMDITQPRPSCWKGHNSLHDENALYTTSFELLTRSGLYRSEDIPFTRVGSSTGKVDSRCPLFRRFWSLEPRGAPDPERNSMA
jgi:hypothetical protein